MRTAIFISGMMIANAISKGVPYADKDSIKFLAVAFIIFAIVDTIEFFHKLTK